jgi:hypothetical protein
MNLHQILTIKNEEHFKKYSLGIEICCIIKKIFFNNFLITRSLGAWASGGAEQPALKKG